jgi:hypothetical protein
VTRLSERWLGDLRSEDHRVALILKSVSIDAMSIFVKVSVFSRFARTLSQSGGGGRFGIGGAKAVTLVAAIL